MTDHQLKEASVSWNTALIAVKETAENFIKKDRIFFNYSIKLPRTKNEPPLYKRYSG